MNFNLNKAMILASVCLSMVSALGAMASQNPSLSPVGLHQANRIIGGAPCKGIEVNLESGNTGCRGTGEGCPHIQQAVADSSKEGEYQTVINDCIKTEGVGYCGTSKGRKGKCN